MKLVSIPEGQEVVGLTLCAGKVFVATNLGVYQLNDEFQLVPLMFVMPEEGMLVKADPCANGHEWEPVAGSRCMDNFTLTTWALKKCRRCGDAEKFEIPEEFVRNGR